MTSTERIVLFAILLSAAVLRFAVVMILDVEPTSDAAAYLRMATTMLETGDMRDGHGLQAFYSAGYPLFLIPFFWLFGVSADVAQMVNAVLGVLSVLLVYLCAREVLASWKWASVAAVLWLAYPPAILYTEYVAKENLMVFLLLLQTFLLLRFENSRHKVVLSCVLGVVFGFQLLVGAAVLLTGALVALIVVGLKRSTRRLGDLRPGHLLVFMSVAALALSPWLYYTNARLGAPILNTNSGFNLYLGNNPSAEVGFVGIQHTPIGPRWAEIRTTNDEVAAMNVLKDLALQHMAEHPLETVLLSVKKLGYFWMPPVHEGKGGNQDRLESLMRVAWLVAYSTIIALALVPLLSFRQLKSEHWLLYATVILYCLIHAAAYIIFRYRIPVMPIMSIMAAHGLYLMYAYTRLHFSEPSQAPSA